MEPKSVIDEQAEAAAANPHLVAFIEPVKVLKLVTDEQGEAAPANPQSFLYFWVLFSTACITMVPFTAVPSIIRDNPSRFKAHGGFFVIMTIASVSLAVLASGILILSSFVLQSWMKDIHYTILKSIGLFSALLAPFSLGAVVFLPMGNLTWIVYSTLCLIFVGMLFVYYFIWKHACLYQQNKQSNIYLFHWATFLIFLAPLSIICVGFFPASLEWAATPVVVVSFSVLLIMLVATYGKLSRIKQDVKKYGISEDK